MSPRLQRVIEELHALLANADGGTLLVLSGAGMSAESGVPTFRDAQTGLWAQFRAEELATPQGFAENPERVWLWYQWRRELVRQAMPHQGHHLLAALGKQLGSRMRMATQNVDGLHQLAGSSKVIELHGNLMRSICHVTRRAVDTEWLQRHQDCNPPPSPHHSRGLVRPDVVWFGEALPGEALQAAMAAAQACRLCLVIGSSGLVHPAAALPHMARENGATLIEINPEATPLTPLVDLHLAEPASSGLARLL